MPNLTVSTLLTNLQIYVSNPVIHAQPFEPNFPLTSIKTEDFKHMYNSLPLVPFARAASSGSQSVGLPTVFFPCLGHGHAPINRPLVIGCSSDRWERLLNDAVVWRAARFSDAAIRGATNTAGTRTGARFNWVISELARLKSGTDTTWRARADARNLTDAEYNEVVEHMYAQGNMADGAAGTEILPARSGFNHTTEPGRSLWGGGTEMGEELSRCWKCRFVFHYFDDYNHAGATHPAMQREDPRTTAFKANAPLNCAEDLCHYFCTVLEPNPAEPPAGPMDPFP